MSLSKCCLRTVYASSSVSHEVIRYSTEDLVPNTILASAFSHFCWYSAVAGGMKVGQLHRWSKWFAPQYVSGQGEQLWSTRLTPPRLLCCCCLLLLLALVACVSGLLAPLGRLAWSTLARAASLVWDRSKFYATLGTLIHFVEKTCTCHTKTFSWDYVKSDIGVKSAVRRCSVLPPHSLEWVAWSAARCCAKVIILHLNLSPPLILAVAVLL